MHRWGGERLGDLEVGYGILFPPDVFVSDTILHVLAASEFPLQMLPVSGSPTALCVHDAVALQVTFEF